MNQSKLEAKTCSRREARENVCERVAIGFGFTSDWLRARKWREVFLNQSLSLVMQNQRFVEPKQMQIILRRKWELQGTFD